MAPAGKVDAVNAKTPATETEKTSRREIPCASLFLARQRSDDALNGLCNGLVKQSAVLRAAKMAAADDRIEDFMVALQRRDWGKCESDAGVMSPIKDF
jgi:hypothetical protein